MLQRQGWAAAANNAAPSSSWTVRDGAASAETTAPHIRVLGATAMACESDALPAANRARLIELRHLLVSRITMMCARAPSENIQLTVLINIFSGTCDLGELPRCVARVTHVPGSKLSFWAAELTPEYTRPFQIIWCFDNDLDVSKFALHIAARAMI